MKISSFQELCASLQLSPLNYRLFALVGVWWELEDRDAAKQLMAMPCCRGAEGLPVPLLSQIQQGMGAVICSPSDAAAPKPQPVWTTSLSAPAPQVANPPAKGPKSRFDGQITKAMLKNNLKSPPSNNKVKENTHFPYTFR